MVWNLEKGIIEPEIHTTLAGLIAAYSDADAICVDVPIGLSDIGTRQCDVEARCRLGKGRSSSVFPPPIYEILDAPTFVEAQRLSVAAIGRGTSQQAFGIFGKIKEANDTVTRDPQDRVFEIHPEISFWALAGRPMVHAKKGELGYEERRTLLREATYVEIRTRKEAFSWARPAKPDDLLDAFVAAWSAKRVAAGTGGRLPNMVETGTHNLRMEIVY